MRTLLALAVVVLAPQAAPATSAIGIIPAPVSLTPGTGQWKLQPSTALLVAPDTAETRSVAAYFANAVSGATGFQLAVKPSSGKAAVRGAIVLSLRAQPKGNPEAYTLDVTPRGVRIEACGAAGLFYGVQTLLQLLPPGIESLTRRNVAWTAPSVRIEDAPRFAWRGLLLDVSRHFFGKEIVKGYIDRMARYKFNVLHMHLTDDHGWRIEIKSRPNLAKVGAWRVPRFARFDEAEPPREGEAATDGGFYTQDDMRELIAYARERFVTILPEIEMPAHSLAAIASYPELSCTGIRYAVNPGSAYGDTDTALCPGNEQTFEYIEQVLSEISALFPSEFIHIGGDECDKRFWRKCPKCQRRIAEEHLNGEEELQSYLIRRAEKILQAKGKRLVGWDEILQGGLAPNATVMSWRGMSGGVAAAKMGHEVVMSPVEFAYLDYYQGDPTLEPSTFGRLLLSTCYKFEPVPEGVDPKLILGGQGNLWTESVPNPRHIEYMTWPRGLALAEVLWSPNTRRDWDKFFGRVEQQFPRLDAAEVNYSRAVYDVQIQPVEDSAGRLAVTMATEVSGCDIYYTLDGTNPDAFMPKYAGSPVTVPPGAYVVKAIAYRNGRPSGRMLSLTTKQLEDRLGRKKS